jgi:sulfite exporter TauE/SafE/copper chaperone CopZ/plastocyanin domain-containing protein
MRGIEMAMITKTIRIGGMTCVNCQNRIESKLKSTAGVEEACVNYNNGTATVTWNSQTLTSAGITAVIEALDYQVLDDQTPAQAACKQPKAALMEIIGTLVIILSLYTLLRGLGLKTISQGFPLAASGMGYGMLFIIGLITSVHCIAMCGGINLSQCLRGSSPAQNSILDEAGSAPAARRFLAAPILYNTGRIVSYTAVGVIVGALGSVFSISGRFQGIVQLIAGVFMVIMGLNMLNLFPWLRRFTPRLPKLFAKKLNVQEAGNKNPLIIGLLNGLMPCGPLQAMQIYALSTGSPIAGGISMFLFSMGTVPLMFGIGALSSLLSGVKGRVFSMRVMKAGAVLVTVMGMTMFSYGWSLGGLPDPAETIYAGINSAPASGASGEAFKPIIENGVQLVNSTLSGGRYPAITVQQGIPVKWTINAPQGSINGCNNRMIIREYKIEHRFSPGENIIEFMPVKTGKFTYSCWMGMIRSSITVVGEGQAADSNAADALPLNITPAPAGVAIPANKVALAKIQTGRGGIRYQTVTISLNDEGIDQSIIVVQRGIPFVWTINNDSLDSGNSRLIFPAYYKRLDIKQGDNVIELMPGGDFDFSTGDNVFYGLVKVVDDLGSADIEAIKTEAANFETMIYPDSYFEAAASGAGCCG